MVANVYPTSRIRRAMIAVLMLALLLSLLSSAAGSMALKQFQPSIVSVAARGVAGAWSTTLALQPQQIVPTRVDRAYSTALQPERWQRAYTSAGIRGPQVNWGN